MNKLILLGLMMIISIGLVNAATEYCYPYCYMLGTNDTLDCHGDSLVGTGPGGPDDGSDTASHAPCVIAGGVNVTVKNCNFVNCSYAVLLSGAQYAHILNNNISTAMFGIYLNNASHNIISGNNIAYTTDDNWVTNDAQGISTWQNDQYNLISNNKVTGGEIGILLNTDYNTINHNNITNAFQGITLWSTANHNMVTNNDIISADPISLQQSNWNNISGNRVTAGNFDPNMSTPSPPSNIGISMWVTVGNVINNNIIFNGDTGIYLQEGNHNNITSNTVSNAVDNGVFLSVADNNIVSSNNVHDNGNDGILLQQGVNNTFSKNTATHNVANGIRFGEGAAFNTLSDNSITYNGVSGIQFAGETEVNNTLTKNTVCFQETDLLMLGGNFNQGGNNIFDTIDWNGMGHTPSLRSGNNAFGKLRSCIAQSESQGQTRYLVDANGNVVGIVQNDKLLLNKSGQAPQLSIAGQGSAFDIVAWFKDLWKGWFG